MSTVKWRDPLGCLVALAFLAGCGAAKEDPPKKAPVVQAKPSDESRRFPTKNQTRMQLVERDLLDKGILPGGNLAEYKHRGKTYQQFLVRAESAEKAALLLFDLKTTLNNPKYLAHMGGYFGTDREQPVYIFAKGVFLAGFIGLAEKEAELLAREFAARL